MCYAERAWFIEIYTETIINLVDEYVKKCELHDKESDLVYSNYHTVY